jgi:hypothetical protein
LWGDEERVVLARLAKTADARVNVCRIRLLDAVLYYVRRGR